MSKIKLMALLLVTLIIFINPPVFALPENSCVDCHKKPDIISTLPKWQQEIFGEWSDSTHSIKGVTCEKCHGGDPNETKKEQAHKGVKDSSDPGSPIYYKNIPATCGSCHVEVYNEFKKSWMFHNLELGKLAPTCATCMGSHEVAVLDAITVTEKCSLCHNKIMGVRPEIPGEAKRLLILQEQVRGELLKAQKNIKTAKEMGKDVTKAEMAFQEAKSRMDKSGAEWHKFMISGFEGEMSDALYYASRANNLAFEAIAEIPPAPKEPKKAVCGPISILFIAMLPLVIFNLKRKLY